MAKLRAKTGLITIEYDSKVETIETEYNGNDKWIFKIVQLKPLAPTAQCTIASFNSEELEKKTILSEEKVLENITPEEIAVYIKNKPRFEHDVIELQERFLKRRVIARKNPKLYSAFERRMKEARNIISRECTGTWEVSATRKSYGGRNYANVYRFKPVGLIFEDGVGTVEQS